MISGPPLLAHDCKVLHGTSGAPLLARDGNGWTVIGISIGSRGAVGVAIPVSILEAIE